RGADRRSQRLSPRRRRLVRGRGRLPGRRPALDALPHRGSLMGYVAVRGGEDAIANAEGLVDGYRRRGGGEPLAVDALAGQLRLAVDGVMAEGSLYDPTLAALALKQAEGDLIEAAFLLRAYRSTLPRIDVTPPLDTDATRLIRRISAAFKDVPGGQML